MEKQTWIPFSQGCFKCTKFGWNWSIGSGEEENVKSLWRRRRQQGQRGQWQLHCDQKS